MHKEEDDDEVNSVHHLFPLNQDVNESAVYSFDAEDQDTSLADGRITFDNGSNSDSDVGAVTLICGEDDHASLFQHGDKIDIPATSADFADTVVITHSAEETSVNENDEKNMSAQKGDENEQTEETELVEKEKRKNKSKKKKSKKKKKKEKSNTLGLHGKTAKKKKKKKGRRNSITDDSTGTLKKNKKKKSKKPKMGKSKRRRGSVSALAGDVSDLGFSDAPSPPSSTPASKAPSSDEDDN